MRATALKILLLSCFGLVASAEAARPHTAARPAPARHGHQTAGLRAPRRASAHARPVHHGSRLSAWNARALQPAETPREAVPLPEIHVTHDRKHHLHAAPVEAPVRASNVSQRVARRAVREMTERPLATTRPHIVPEDPALVLPVLTYRRGRIILPPALKGSHEILLRQNEMADRDGLYRVQDDADLASMRERGMLVLLPVSAELRTDERLPANRRYCRPWAAAFLVSLARAHYARFHTPLQVNSAVRTVEFQQKLLRTNGNAAPADGDTASPHLTGQAIDLAKHRLSLSEIAWLRAFLSQLTQEGKIDVEEEFQQSCFHISVYRRYAPQAGGTRMIEDFAPAPAIATAVTP